MSTIAVIGPGAIGGVVAAWLAQDPAHAVTVCARTPLADLVVETPEGTITATPTILTDAADAAPVDWVLVATKAYDADATAPWLARLLNPQTRVAILQNGAEHVERFAHLVPTEQLLPAVVELPAGRSAPGRMTQYANGAIAVPDGPDGDAFVALFGRSVIAATTDPDIRSRAWQKLCLNAAGAVGALTFASTGPAWTPELEAIVHALAAECAAVGRAEGATIPDSIVEAVVARARAAMPNGNRNSMETDRLAGRPMEIEARNGVIVRLGLKNGVPTPVNAMVTALLRASASPWVEGGPR